MSSNILEFDLVYVYQFKANSKVFLSLVNIVRISNSLLSLYMYISLKLIDACLVFLQRRIRTRNHLLKSAIPIKPEIFHPCFFVKVTFALIHIKE